jgi:hypothetical protein
VTGVQTCALPIYCKISNADIKRLEKAGFEWRLK